MTVDSIWQYPIKGVGGSSLSCARLSVHPVLSGDRRYALSTKSTRVAQFEDNFWFQKTHFLQLVKTEALAALRCQLDHEQVIIHTAGTKNFQGNLAHPSDRAKCQSFIANFLQMPNSSALRIHKIDNGAYTDQSAPLISIGGSASLAAFATATKTTTDERRFRLNIILNTDTPFVENHWCGALLQIGGAVIEIVNHVGRCAAINVDPETAKRQPNHLPTMRKRFGHNNLGIFGRVIRAGALQIGDSASLLT